ncbi:MAG: alpha-2-macroglobulin family protein, partial [Lentisphaeria bacterium]|nr:alpha-2-macroglobulin family protein [Lentisphaeria bacterium]
DETDGAVLSAAPDGNTRGVRFKAAGFGGIAEMEGLAMAAAPTLRDISNLARESGAADQAGGAADDAAAPAAIRSLFADTALWVASLDTQTDGTATVTVPMPENLTAWKMRVWAVDGHTRVGMGATELVTSKDLILRLQAPRFFVEKDEVVLSANVHNYLPAAQTVEVKLELDGPCLQMMSPPAQTVVIAAGAEARADWRVKAVREGEAVVRMFALAQAESDAMEQRFPVKVHGIDKTVAATGFLRPEQTSAQVKLVIPAERRPETTRLTVRWSPSLALAMLDAIPYLLDYPYGCTEQTLNRFLPAVLTRDTLRRLGLNLADLQKQRANLNAQELGDPDTRRQQWQRTGRDPVFSEDEMDKMTAAGVRDLCAMQCADGGWGWFSGWGERSWAHTTAQVVHGFRLAQTAGVDIPEAALQRGVAWLQDYQAEELRRLRLPKNHRDYKTYADNVDALVFRVLAEAPEPGKSQPPMADLLFRDKPRLSPYGLALFGLGLSADPAESRTADVLRNLKQFLVTDDENQTAWLNLGNSGFWWFWYGDEMETHAAFLRLLVALEPDGDLAPRLVKYLLNNRKHATYWRSTRDTAACLEAFAAFIAKTGEQAPDLTVDLSLDGKPLATSRITRDNLFTADLTLDLTGDKLTTGEHTLLLHKTGTGPLYFNTYLSYFTTEDMIRKTGLEVKIDRQVFQLVREDGTAQAPSAQGQVVAQRVEKYRRVPVASDAAVHSGDLLEIELTVESKNDYEYILLEDFKPAGCEPVDLRSGYNGNAFGAYVEFRDDRAAFLLRTLPRGRRSATYRVRAEVPGRFSALPAILTGMYAPELRANADEIKIVILDEK